MERPHVRNDKYINEIYESWYLYNAANLNIFLIIV